METNNTQSYFTETRRAESYVNSVSEYVLPDYNPDIRKLMLTDCSVKSAGKLESDESVEYTGIVEYRCIYSGRDGELSELCFTSDYEYSLPLTGECVSVESFPTVQGYQIRVLGPRKISAKATLLCENVYSDGVCVESFSEIPECELLSGEVTVGRMKRLESEEREVAEEIARLEGVSLDECNIISSLATVVETTEKRDGDILKCKSTVSVKLLYRDGDGCILPLSSEICAEGEINVRGLPTDASVICIPTLLSERCECLPTEDGVSVVANLILRFEAVCHFNESHVVTLDGYFTDCEAQLDYGTLGTASYLEPIYDEIVVEGECAPEGVDGATLREVLLCASTAKISECICDGAAVTLTAELKLQGVLSYADSNGKILCSPLKVLDNTAKKVKLSSKNVENTVASVRIAYCRSDEKIDGDKIKYTHTVGLCIIPCICESTRIMTRFDRVEQESVERPVGRVTVYYTESGDSVFSVAKRYHTPIKKLCEDNAISTSAMSGDEPTLPKRLIIY